MEAVFPYIYQVLESISFLVLAAMGMSIIYGMMRITNLATAQLIMIGCYVTAILVNRVGLPLPIAIIGAMLFDALVGFVLDRLIMQRLYSRPMDSIVVTWGISIIISQVIFLLFGPDFQSVSIPFGSFTAFGHSYSVYRVVLMVVMLIMVGVLYLLFNYTRFGLHSRATMQNREIANALGINANKMNVSTFMIGSALAGLTGGLYVPTMTISPSIGANFMTQSFVTVIVGGTNPLIGTIMAGSSLGIVEGIVTLAFGTFYGRIAILLVAIVFIRFLPDGFSGLVKGGIQRKKTR